MNQNEPSNWKRLFSGELRFDDLFRLMRSHVKVYVVAFATAAVVSVVIALSLPRYYEAGVMLAPEYASSSGGGGGGLGSLASLAGINLGSSGTEDAIYPQLYPDLLESTEFQVSLFNVPLRTADGTYRGTLADYMRFHQKVPWWTRAKLTVTGWFSAKKKPEAGEPGRLNPFSLTRDQMLLSQAIGAKIQCMVDEKTSVITLRVRDQDRLVCAELTQEVCRRLQDFIIEYRTKKAKKELSYLLELQAEAFRKYSKKQQEYAHSADENQDVVLQAYRSRQTSLENEMQLAYNVYSQLSQQVEMARAKVLEKTPVFTTIQNVTVPVQPAGPRRMFIVLGFMIVAGILATVYIIFKK